MEVTLELKLINLYQLTASLCKQTCSITLKEVYTLQQPCPTRRPQYTFLAPSLSTLFEPIININSNVKTKNIFECLRTVKYFHIIISSSK
jgi:hypothetical protein